MAGLQPLIDANFSAQASKTTELHGLWSIPVGVCRDFFAESRVYVEKFEPEKPAFLIVHEWSSIGQTRYLEEIGDRAGGGHSRHGQPISEIQGWLAWKTDLSEVHRWRMQG